jgi:hypothetical protein
MRAILFTGANRQGTQAMPVLTSGGIGAGETQCLVYFALQQNDKIAPAKGAMAFAAACCIGAAGKVGAASKRASQ